MSGVADKAEARLTEAVAAVLSGTPQRKLKIVVLNKALFYLDLYALRDLGHTVTGAQFVAFENGPVVEGYRRRVVGACERRGIAKQLTHGKSMPPPDPVPAKPTPKKP